MTLVSPRPFYGAPTCLLAATGPRRRVPPQFWNIHQNSQLVDPISNTNNLNARLKSLGLYAADTVGGKHDVSATILSPSRIFILKSLKLASLDGNCLFRALSDQLYGSQSKHAELRREICDFIEAHKDDYAGFVEDPRGFDVHLKCMRQSGTSTIPLTMPCSSLFARSPPVSRLRHTSYTRFHRLLAGHVLNCWACSYTCGWNCSSFLNEVPRPN